jgi:hypothetical protein
MKRGRWQALDTKRTVSIGAGCLPVMVLVFLSAWPVPAPACSLCASLQQQLTFRQEAAQPGARIIVFGSMSNPRLDDGKSGLTDFTVESVLRSHPFLKEKKVLQIPQYIPVTDPKDPPHFLLFCDVFNEKLDPYRGIPVKSKAVVAYLEAAMKLPAEDRTRTLEFFAGYLEHADRAIAEDAFLEFAKSTDQEIGQLAGKIPAARLRAWLADREIPSNRLNLYGFMLGACGQAEDADLLRNLLEHPTDRTSSAFDGLLTGYILLRPKEGWDTVFATLKDSQKAFTYQQCVHRCLRFLHGWKPKENREQILRGMDLMLERNDLADLAIEDLRRWQDWDLSVRVFGLYGKKDFDAPIMRRAIVRYALCCPRTESKQLLGDARQREPKLVADVEESLEYERKPIR